MPDEYDPKFKEWIIENLPIIPDEMTYKYKGSTSQQKQGQIIIPLYVKEKPGNYMRNRS